ncbi:hypothetical protein QBC37DRAFT_481493 [Rhypophila decipiens]|uniref:Uncharacterized protein n=1 Tax=Rhypophila decipiens TaxID=261697 RepID=A0AAN7B9G5_9PEZI|nr:hypothetical protein QBC37DRAFT_481493 [Rhypophila decipiens]
MAPSMAHLLLRKGTGSGGKAIASHGPFRIPLRGQKRASNLFPVNWVTRLVLQQNTTPAMTPRLNIMTRSFHADAIYNSTCDSGDSGDSGGPSECTERRLLEESCDRWGPPKFRCEPCWASYIETLSPEIRDRERKEAAHRKKLSDYTEYLKSLPPGEQVPIQYAVEKYRSELNQTFGSYRWHREHLCRTCSEQLGILKVRGRYVCDKARVDAMDWKLWYWSRYWDEDI